MTNEMKAIVLFLLAGLIYFIGVSLIYFIVWCVCRIKKKDFKEYSRIISISLITSVLCNLVADMILKIQ